MGLQVTYTITTLLRSNQHIRGHKRKLLSQHQLLLRHPTLPRAYHHSPQLHMDPQDTTLEGHKTTRATPIVAMAAVDFVVGEDTRTVIDERLKTDQSLSIQFQTARLGYW